MRSRAVALATIRRFLHDRCYLEVPTPVMVPSAALEEHLYPLRADGGLLRTSPEFALKRVIAAGLPRVYEIGPCFRGREAGPWHGSEFLMLEWYRAGAALEDLAREATDLVDAVAVALGKPPLPWAHTTVRALVLAACGVDVARAAVADLSSHEADHTWDDAFFRRWVDSVEPSLRGALVVSGWPASQAALAAVRSDGDWPVARRFEIIVDGVELANAFEELVDGRELQRRFVQSNAARVASGEPPHPVDLDLIDAVGRMPPTSGIAVGIDRLVAVIEGWPGIARGRVPA